MTCQGNKATESTLLGCQAPRVVWGEEEAEREQGLHSAGHGEEIPDRGDNECPQSRTGLCSCVMVSKEPVAPGLTQPKCASLIFTAINLLIPIDLFGILSCFSSGFQSFKRPF